MWPIKSCDVWLHIDLPLVAGSSSHTVIKNNNLCKDEFVRATFFDICLQHITYLLDTCIYEYTTTTTTTTPF